MQHTAVVAERHSLQQLQQSTPNTEEVRDERPTRQSPRRAELTSPLEWALSWGALDLRHNLPGAHECTHQQME
eukprot:scaffold34763_cov36-Tisochrysis_lutea.AAC.3